MYMMTWQFLILQLNTMKFINQVLKKYLVLLFIVGLLFACSSNSQKKTKPENASLKEKVSVETFRSSDGWGYEIKVEGKTKIKQEFIPVIEGNLPFDSEMEARRIGELVLKRMSRYSLPTITKHDLDSLQIKY